ASNVPEDGDIIPKQFGLEQNYPNPFNPSTAIRIAVPKSSRVNIQVYDILGQEVATIANREFEPGYHNLLWNCQACAAGIYFVQMRAGEFVQTRKMLIVK
ncbi:MAG: T9SS type A sorting domain-containing protein, partial [bacterium]